jgi:hypothetical protein
MSGGKRLLPLALDRKLIWAFPYHSRLYPCGNPDGLMSKILGENAKRF